ncbi:MAG: DHA2 family efflux MFS transporter permease subunit [Elusimicrobia bacterium]|nr:DHA2 family efflux MFS transporter permease subunit [Elusimicrobiota bacterium]
MSETANAVLAKLRAPGFRKWLVTLAVMPGTFLSVMDITVVNTAMPHMMGSLGQTLSDIAWVGTAYSIAEIMMITMAGWWSTVLGRRRLLLGSMALFAAASVLCGQAHTFGELLAFRVLQGVGGGALIPISQAVLRETFPPEEQGLAMGIYGMGVVVAPAIGPVLGGWLTDNYGWRWVFYINPPIAVGGILLAAALVWDPPFLRRTIKRVDWAGIGLLATGLTSLQIVLERGQEKNWFASRQICWGFAAAVVSLVALVAWELRADEPVVDFRLFRDAPLAAGSAIAFITSMALFGTTFLMPQMLQNLMGYTAYQSGIALLPRALILFALMPVVGRLYNRVDARLLIGGGLCVLFLSYWQLAHLATSFAFRTLVPIMLVMGSGQPFTFVTLSTVALGGVEKKDLTTAASLYTLSRRVGGNIAYALMATVVDRRAQFHHARLAESLGMTRPAVQAFRAGLAGDLVRSGVPRAAAQAKALGLLDAMVDRQAVFMSYNDSAWIMGLIVLATLPFVLLLPGRKERKAPS